MEKEKPKVFISHSKKDKYFADLVKTKLYEANIDAWLDQKNNLRGGVEWRRVIDREIANADALVLILSPAAKESSYVAYEWAYALGQRKTVIPLLLYDDDKIDIDEIIPPPLEGVQYFDSKKEEPWQDLISTITKAKAEAATENIESKLLINATIGELTKRLVAVLSIATEPRTPVEQEERGKAEKETPEDRATKDIWVNAMSIAEANLDSERINSKPITVLWVDDRPNNNASLRKAFSSLGFEFELATSTNEALQKLQHTNYDAIISDMARAEGPREGYVLLEALRKNHFTTPYFIYAGSNSPEYKEEAEERGAQGSTDSPKELFELVTKYLSAK